MGGSVGVIVSSLLIYYFNLFISDAICSVFIALLIFLTVYPLLQSTSKVLLHQTPSFILSALKNDLSNVLSPVKGIVGYRQAHFWESEPGKYIGSMHIQVSEDADVQQTLSQIHNILQQRFGLSEENLTIQIEKKYYLDKCDPIHQSVYAQIMPIHAKKSASHSSISMSALQCSHEHHDHSAHHSCNGHHDHHNHEHDHDEHKHHGGHDHHESGHKHHGNHHHEHHAGCSHHNH